MAVETRDIEIGALPPEDADLRSTAMSGPASRSWLASIITLRRHRATGIDGVDPPSENPAVAPAEDAPVPLTMSGVLAAWRVADRALGELTAGSPEWAAVNATIITLRASYQARFEEYTARSSEEREGSGEEA